MAIENTLAINLHKSSASMPWVVVFEAPSGLTFEVSVGEDGNMAAGPRLQELLWEMDKKVVNYPTTYDMQHIGEVEKRQMQTRFMKDKPVFSDVSILFQETAMTEFYPIQMKPFEEQVSLLEGHKAQRPVSNMRTMAMSADYTIDTELREEHPEGSHPYWIVMNPNEIVVKNGGQINGFIEGYIWPDGETIPTSIGNYDTSSARSRIVINYLGIEPFEVEDDLNLAKSKFYNVGSHVLTAAGKEAKGYNENLIKNDGLIAISLQHNRQTGEITTTPEGHGVGSVFSTKYTDFEEVQYAVQSGHIKGININKSLLKEKYSGSDRLKESVNHIIDVPLVEFTGFGETSHNYGIQLSGWARQYSLQEPPSQDTYDELRDRQEEGKKRPPHESINEMIENAAEEITKKGGRRTYAMPNDFIQNDLKFVPAKDDRLENGYLYRTISPEETNENDAMPYDYTHKVRIGDSIFEVPPLSIRVDKQFQNQKMQGMRSKTSIQSQVGHTRSVLTLDLYFHDLENINGREVTIYEEQVNEKGQDVVVHIKQDEEEKEIVPVENIMVADEKGDYEVVTPTRVIDGDTFVYESGGKEVTVRLILVDTPELGKDGKASEPVAEEARDFLRNLILGKEVYLEKDVSDEDVYNRKLRYVYLENGDSVQGELVAEGLARVAPYEPDTKYLRMLRRMESLATRNERGIWAYDDYVTPTGFTKELATLKINNKELGSLSVLKSVNTNRKLNKHIVYYMDGLRSLIAQFKKTPFVPIDNEYINEDLHVHNVALRDIQVNTVDGFPEALQATLVLEEIDVGAYLMGEQSLGELINYPLMRWHYQQMLQEPDINSPHKTYLPKVDRVSNDFSFSIVNKDALENRTNAISQFRSMKIPSRYADDYYNPDANDDAGSNEISKNASKALDEYERFIDFVNNGYEDDNLGISIPKDKVKDYKNEYGYYKVVADVSKDNYGLIKNFFSPGYTIEGTYNGIDLARIVYGVSSKDRDKSNPISFDGAFITNRAFDGQPSDFSNLNLKLEHRERLTEVAENNPGFFLIRLDDERTRKHVEEEVRKWNASIDEYIVDGPIRGQKGIYKFPASDYNGRNSLTLVRELAVKKEEIDEDIDDYTFKYNALAAEINRSEDQMPMDEYLINDLIPMNLTVGLKNNFSEVQVQQAETPTMQYFGASEPQIALTFETDNQGIEQLDSLFRTVAHYAKTYRDGIVSGFMDIHNPLVNMFGINSVIPDAIQYATVPNQPGRFVVNLTFLGFDKSQRRQEALYGFAGGKPSKRLQDLAYDNYDPTIDSLYINEKMRQMELYPDLEMPKVSELNEVLPYINAGIDEWEDYGSGQVYLDPDFYISTETTFRNYLKNVVDGPRDNEFEWSDAEGYVVKSNMDKDEYFIMEEEMFGEFAKMSEETEFSDPETIWDGWRDTDIEANDGTGEEGLAHMMQEASIVQEKMNIPIHPGGELKDYLSGKYKTPPSYTTWLKWTKAGSRARYEEVLEGENGNPSDEDVWYYLAELVQKHFPDIDIQEEEKRAIIRRGAVADESWEEVDVMQGVSLSFLYLTGEFTERTWASTTEFFKENYRAETATFNDKENKLKNGLEDYLMNHNMGRASSATGARDNLKMTFMRVLTHLKSLMRISSGWRQFSGGEPFISARNSQGLPARVGIMGAPIHGKSKAEVERLMWDWKYNMERSVEQMATVYKRALKSPYYEIEIRRLDWAIASHSGEELPAIIASGKASDDKPIGENYNPIAPEKYKFYNDVYLTWYAEAKQNNKDIAPSIYSNGRGQTIPEIYKLYNAIDIQDGETEEGATDRMIHEQNMRIHNNLENWTLSKKVRGMFVDMYQYDHTGRMLRAFPSFALQLIDEGKWYGVYRTWDNFYGYNSLNSIDVYKSRKVAADTAVIEMSNIYGGLTGMRNSQVNHDFRMPSFFSSHYWEHYVLGTPTEEILEERTEIYDSILLETGARIHLRMGYGSDARHLPIMFNGTISEIETGDIVTITAQGDGLELTNVIAGDVDDTNKGLFFVKEPSTTIGELLTQKGNWLQEVVNASTKGLLFKDNPLGIAHFGSVITAQSGNYNPFSDDYGESMQNVYSSNGQMVKEQWKEQNGEKISVIDMYFKPSFQVSADMDFNQFTSDHDEANIGIKLYGTSPWEVIQTFALCSTDYIAAVFPFEMRSSLFFGKPHWPVTYRYSSTYVYDEATGKMRREVDMEHRKTFMQAHIYNSFYNIISNEVTTSAEGVFNNVIVSYDGRSVGPMQADSDIRYDRQTTAHVEANIIAKTGFFKGTRNYYTSESQAQKYGHSTVRDFMKDMYKGSYTVIGDPTVKPYDIAFMNDGLHDMQGIHLIKAVHHSMNGQDGFISIIEPDAYVVNFDADLMQIADKVFSVSKNASIAAVSRGIAQGIGAAILPGVVSKLSKGLYRGILTRVKGIASRDRELVASANRIGKGVISKVQLKTYDMYASAINSKELANSVNRVRRAKKHTEKAELVKAMKELRVDETVRILDKTEGAGDVYKFIKGLKTTKKTQGSHVKTAAQIAVNKGEITTDTLKVINEIVPDLDKIDDIYDAVSTSASMHNAATGATKATAGLSKVKTIGSKVKAATNSTVFKVGWHLLVNLALTAAVSGLREMWTRKKQDAQCVIVYPMTYKGGQMTAAMNGRRGSVYGDDPSLRDRLMNAEFGAGDSEVDDIWWSLIPKILNVI